MIELRKVIHALLKTVHSRVHFVDAPEAATFPYVVYNLPTSTNADGTREDFILEVDVWDNATDTTAIETLTQNIDTLLNREHSINAKVLVNFYRVNRLVLTDDDKSIKRRKLTYQAKTYFL